MRSGATFQSFEGPPRFPFLPDRTSDESLGLRADSDCDIPEKYPKILQKKIQDTR
jgi:hypothetical protein